MNKQDKKNLCLFKMHCACGWIEASMLFALGPPQTECPDLTPSAEI